MSERVLVLGAGFAGLELATMLSEAFGDEAGVTLVDDGDAFVFGYSKLDVMFGHATPDEVRLPYRRFAKPGVRFRKETITAIDAESTPGLVLGENEFYSVAGAERLRDVLPTFTHGRVVVGVCGAPFTCPPAPSEAALLLHDYLSQRGVRDACEIVLTMSFQTPVPPSPDTSAALLGAFAERGIEFVPGRKVAAVEPESKAVVFEDGEELTCDLFLGVPRHRAPDVVLESGMAVDGYVPVDSATLETTFPGVYAVGDVATAGVPKAGVFSEGAARVVAASIIAARTGGSPPEPFDGRGACYIEFGGGRIGRVDIDFLSGPKPTGTLQEPSAALVAEKRHFGSSRRERWFATTAS